MNLLENRNRCIKIDLNFDSDVENPESTNVSPKQCNKMLNHKNDSSSLASLRNFTLDSDEIKNIPEFMSSSSSNTKIKRELKIEETTKFCSEVYIGFDTSSDESSDQEDSTTDFKLNNSFSEIIQNGDEKSNHCKHTKMATFENGNSEDVKTYRPGLRTLRDKAILRNDRKYVCDVCGKIYHKRTNLEKHVNFCSVKTSSTENVCSICGRIYKSKWRLKQHFMISHADSKPFSCNFCHKSYLYKSMLQQHRRIHIRLKPCTCEKCGRSFTTNSDLKKHHKRHKNPGFKTKERISDLSKLENCPLCFKHVVNLHIHMYSHTNNSNADLACNICDKKLKSIQALYAHVRLHTDEKFVCDICNRIFNRKANMLAHKSLHLKPSYKPKKDKNLQNGKTES